MGNKIDDLKVYLLAMEIGDLVWQIVSKWEWFTKKGLGIQFTNSSDSVAANISEGYGRYFYKENRQFCFYARGSLNETRTSAAKA